MGLLALPDDGSNNVKFKLPTGPPVDSLCKYCGHPFTMGGPFWLAPIHDPNFVQGLCESLTEENAAASGVRFNTMERMVGMLTVIGDGRIYNFDGEADFAETSDAKKLAFLSKEP